jgi:predicted deacylase
MWLLVTPNWDDCPARLLRASRQRWKRLALPDAVADAVQDVHTGDAGAHPGADHADRERPAAAADCTGGACRAFWLACQPVSVHGSHFACDRYIAH